MNTARKLYVAPTLHTNETIHESLQDSFDTRFARWFLPHRETRLMSEESTRSGLFVPYPLLALVLALTMALAGGIIGLYSQLSAMQTTMLLRDNDYQRQVHDLKEKQDQMEVYLHNDREKIIAMQAQLDRKSN